MHDVVQDKKMFLLETGIFVRKNLKMRFYPGDTVRKMVCRQDLIISDNENDTYLIYERRHSTRLSLKGNILKNVIFLFIDKFFILRVILRYSEAE